MEINKKILIIIPAYNEQDSILKTYISIKKYNDTHGTAYDVIVINDGSTDETLKICRENNIPTVSLIHNLGIGGAVQTGYKYAYENNYDIALQFDGDGQHDISCVNQIIEPILKHEADLVVGSRFIDNSSSEFKSSMARRFGIKVISFFTKLVTKTQIHDVTSGFRAANQLAIADFARSYPEEFPESITNVELLKKKYIIKEVPVSMNERAGGVSSIRSWKNAYFMINVLFTILIIKARRYRDVR